MRKFKILKWPTELGERPDLSKPYPLDKIFENTDSTGVSALCLNVNGTRIYFYHNEVKEVTDE